MKLTNTLKPRSLRIKLFIAKVRYNSFILSIWGLGIITGVTFYAFWLFLPTLTETKTITITNTVIETAQAQEPKNWLTAEFSAYTASVEETDANPEIMASGKTVYNGAIACPRSIKLGTKIEIDTLGVFTCEDRMNVRYTNNFDVFMESHANALKFGRKEMKYIIL